MSKLKEDLTGRVFERLTVIKRSFTEKPNNVSRWWCVCTCGKIVDVSRTALIRKQTLSCGCYNDDFCRQLGLNSRKEKGHSGFRLLLNEYKFGAKNRGFDFSLSKEEFKKLTQSNCFYCGCAPFKIKELKVLTEEGRVNSQYIHNGVDRKDSSKGYTIENCVPCCTDCNFLKKNINYDKFLNTIKQIYLNRIKEE